MPADTPKNPSVTKTSPEDRRKLMQLMGLDDDDAPAPDEEPAKGVDVSHLRRQFGRAVLGKGEVTKAALDLTGKRKLVGLVGLGGSGKTTTARWLAERATAKKRDVLIASADALKHPLADYFEGVLTPGDEPGLLWMDKILRALQLSEYSAIVDFGGDDTVLLGLAHETPGLAQMLEDSGLHFVLLVFFSNRAAKDAILPLAALEDAGFCPKATALVCNLGAVTGLGGVGAFREVRKQPEYRNAIGRGAEEVVLPRLFGNMPARIEEKQLQFGAAVKDPSFLAMDQSRVDHWLKSMEQAFGRVSSWLP